MDGGPSGRSEPSLNPPGNTNADKPGKICSEKATLSRYDRCLGMDMPLIMKIRDGKQAVECLRCSHTETYTAREKQGRIGSQAILENRSATRTPDGRRQKNAKPRSSP
jgi:hypothetical protein